MRPLVLLGVLAGALASSAVVRAQDAGEVPERNENGSESEDEDENGSESEDEDEDENGSEDEDDSEDEDEDEVLFGATGVVDVRLHDALPTAASDFQLSLEPFRSVPRTSAESLLSLAPSVFLVNHSGSYHASTLYVRGFDAGEGQDLEILVDGVPLNETSNAHGHGYADTHFIIPELVSSVRFTEGPYAPGQGDFAVAGTAEYLLGPAQRGVQLLAQYGSFESRRLLLTWAPIGASQGTFLGVDLRDSQGFGVNRASTSAALNGRLELAVARDVTFTLFGAAQLADFDSAGVVRADDVRLHDLPCADTNDAQFFCTEDPNQGGSSHRALLSAGLTWRGPHALFTAVLFGGYRGLRIRENFTGFTRDARGDGLDEQYEAGTVGLRATYRFAGQIFGREQQFELGVTSRHDSGTSRNLRLRAGSGIPYSADFDDEIHVTRVGAHIGTDLSFFDWLSLRIGARADVFAFSTVERALPTTDRVGERLPIQATDAIGIAFQPRATLRIRLADLGTNAAGERSALEWQTSAGVGTRSSDAIALSEGETAPFAEVVSSETGLTLRAHGEGELVVDARAVAFHTHVDHDLVFDVTRGRNVDIGASSRLGALGYLNVHVAPWMNVQASFAWTEAYLLARDAGYFDLTSNDRLPYVPRWVGRLDVAGEQPVTVDAESVAITYGLGVGWLGERPLPLGQVAQQTVVVDAQLGVRWRGLELSVIAQNLLDQRWQSSVFNYASWFDTSEAESRTAQLHFAAGAPLSITGRLSFRFDETTIFGGETTEEAPTSSEEAP